MHFDTAHFGQLEINDRAVITFEDGLPGFEDHKEFVILNNHDTEEPVPFMWLQSVKDKNLALVLTIPYFARPDYAFDVPEEVVQKLSANSPEDLGVYAVVTIKDQLEAMTVNLASPILVSTKSRRAVQWTLDNATYGVKEPYSHH